MLDEKAIREEYYKIADARANAFITFANDLRKQMPEGISEEDFQMTLKNVLQMSVDSAKLALKVQYDEATKLVKEGKVNLKGA